LRSTSAAEAPRWLVSHAIDRHRHSSPTGRQHAGLFLNHRATRAAFPLPRAAAGHKIKVIQLI
jgi:hypothetical protein